MECTSHGTRPVPYPVIVMSILLLFGSCRTPSTLDAKSLLALIDSGRIAEAKERLSGSSMDKASVDPQVRHVWAYLYEKEGDLDSAQSLYEQNLSNPNADLDADHLGLGRVAYRQGEYDSALNWFWKVMANDSCYGSVRYYMGLTLAALDKNDAAIGAYLGQLKCDSTDTVTMHNLAMLYMMKGDHAEAIHVLERKLARHYAEEDMLKIVMAYHQSNDDATAMSILDSNMVKHGGSASSWVYRATLWMHMDQNDSMIADLTKALELDSINEGAVGMATFLEKRGRLRASSPIRQSVRK